MPLLLGRWTTQLMPCSRYSEVYLGQQYIISRWITFGDRFKAGWNPVNKMALSFLLPEGRLVNPNFARPWKVLKLSVQVGTDFGRLLKLKGCDFFDSKRTWGKTPKKCKGVWRDQGYWFGAFFKLWITTWSYTAPFYILFTEVGYLKRWRFCSTPEGSLYFTTARLKGNKFSFFETLRSISAYHHIRC